MADLRGNSTVGGYAILHAGNPLTLLDSLKNVDGTGSGLDADTLDGVHGTQFVRNDCDNTIVGDARLFFGPNPSWGQYLTIGGNGNTYTGHATICTTDGNLHLDAKTGHDIYLGNYTGGNIRFGSGGGTYIDPNGVYHGTATNATNATNATTSSYSTYLTSTSHNTYYLSNAWDGTYWQLTSNHGAHVNVGHATNAGYADSANVANSATTATTATFATKAGSLSSGATINGGAGWSYLSLTGNSQGWDVAVQQANGAGAGLEFRPSGSDTTKITMTTTGLINANGINSNAQSSFLGYQTTSLATSTGGLGGLMVQSNGSGSAFMSFHRPGSYASYFGLDTDNQWAVGGWSAGATRRLLAFQDQIPTTLPANGGTSATCSGNSYSTYYKAQTGEASTTNSDTNFNSTPAGCSGFRELNGSANAPNSGWWFMENYRHSNGSNFWGNQMAYGWEDNANRIMTRNVSGGGFSPWYELITSKNIASQSVSYASTAGSAPANGGSASQIANGSSSIVFEGNHAVLTTLGQFRVQDLQGNLKGYLYHDSSGFGLLHGAGGWSVNCTPSGVNLYGTVTGNGGTLATTAQIPTSLPANGGTATTISGTITGNQVSSDRGNTATDVITAREIRWSNYGNQHTVIENSSGAYGSNGNVNTTAPWTAGYPVLMGFNGSSTYGVRVDSARVADSATYSANSSKLYATGSPYGYGESNPYYGYLSYNAGVGRWRFAMSPASPSAVEVAYADSAGNAGTVGGCVPDSTAGTASRVVVANTSGYIMNTWFNSNRGAENSPAEAYLYDTGDGYMRKKSVANVKAELGITSLVLGNVVTVLTGTIANGGTIPLPSGYTQEQCKWMVSPLDCTGYDYYRGISCSASSNRVVSCSSYYISSGELSAVNASANYIIIGVK